jgi:hypothetical protein
MQTTSFFSSSVLAPVMASVEGTKKPFFERLMSYTRKNPVVRGSFAFLPSAKAGLCGGSLGIKISED